MFLSTLGRQIAVVACLACVFVEGRALANGVGSTVVGGQASFSTQGTTLNITNSPGAIINWQSFSIGAGETTRFIQQSAASTVLNRVVGADPSVILGTLTSNGRVFLINPSGILVGQGARIDVAGFVASTLDLSNEDFLAGRLNFVSSALAGNVENQGRITTPSGGSVYLVGPNVTNSGIINSPQGNVVLAAGQSVTLLDSGTPGVSVKITGSDNNVVNLGEILAQSGNIGIYGAGLRNAGLINADQVVQDASGKIILRATQNATLDNSSRISANGTQGGDITVQSETGTTMVSGSIEAKGTGSGGSVHLLGNRVGLMAANIDASGTSGGGTVLIGGDSQGKNPSVQNASATYVSPDTSVKADALTNGNGGKVVVWSEGSTKAYGSFSAQGGAQAGNGGLIETSGHFLDVNGIGINASAPYGQAGTWLLDPWNVTITTAAVSSGAWRVPSPANTIWDTTASTSNVTNTTISGYLNAGTNVFITTTPFPTDAGTEPGNITVNAPILHDSNSAGSPNVTLTLTAGTTGIGKGNILVNSSISAVTGSNVLNVDLNSPEGSVMFGPGVSLSTNGGNVTIHAGTTANLGNITTGVGTVTATAGGTLSLYGTVTSNNTGNAVVLSGSSFYNAVGASALSTPSGRWLVYSTNPGSDTRGSLLYDFKQYNLAYGGASPASATGNGFIYSVAPLLTPSLTGTISKPYDGTPDASLASNNYTIAGVLDGDTVVLNNPTSGSFLDKNVAPSKSVTASGASTITSATNGSATVYGYQISATPASGVGEITPATLTGVITANNKPYDGTTTATLSSQTLIGPTYNSDASNLVLTNTAANFNTQDVLTANTVTATGLALSGTAASNYQLSSTSATDTLARITPATLTGVITANNKPYDGTTTATLSSQTLIGPTYNSDASHLSLTDTAANFNTQDVLTANTVTATGLGLSGSAASNYQLSSTSATDTLARITPATLTGVITANNKPYDGTTTATLSSQTLIGPTYNSDASHLALTDTAANFNTKDVLTANTVTATGLALSGSAASDYQLSSTSATALAHLTPAPLTVIADPQSKVYGTADPALTFSVIGLVDPASTVLSGTLTRASGETVVASPYVLTQGSLVANSNYTISSFTGNALAITPAPLNVAANPQSKIFGTPDPALTYNVTGLVSRPALGILDTSSAVLSGALTRIPGESALGGPYAITQGSLVANSNYTLSYTSNNLTITGAASPSVLGFNAPQVVFAQVVNNVFYYRPGNFWHISLNFNNADPGFDVMRGTNNATSRQNLCASAYGGGFCETWSFPQQF